MNRRVSYSQRVFPADAEFTSTLEELQRDGVRTMLEYLWAGFDAFKDQVIDRNEEPTRRDADLERDLMDLFVPYVSRLIPARSPYYLHPEKKEHESALPGAQPPEPDLSFVFFSNPRVTFPVDAKVVEKDRPSAVTDYVNTVNDRFVACVYAPFSKHGAMLAFFLAGSVKTLLSNIRAGLGCSLSRGSYFRGRYHKTSEHERMAAACNHKSFTCHHLVMPVGAGVTA
jgi:hypothetical protein